MSKAIDDGGEWGESVEAAAEAAGALVRALARAARALRQETLRDSVPKGVRRGAVSRAPSSARGEGGEGSAGGQGGRPTLTEEDAGVRDAMVDAVHRLKRSPPRAADGRPYLTQLAVLAEAGVVVERWTRLSGMVAGVLEELDWKRGERIYRRDGEGKPTRERVTPYYLEEVGCPTCGAEVAEGKPHEAWCGRKGAEG